MKISIKTKEAEEGMELADPVINNFGQVLIAAGVKITFRHINLLKTWSIETITVHSGPEQEEELLITEEMRESAGKILEHKLKWEPENQHEKEIYELALLTIAQKVI